MTLYQKHHLIWQDLATKIKLELCYKTEHSLTLYIYVYFYINTLWSRNTIFFNKTRKTSKLKTVTNIIKQSSLIPRP